jgi:hypothetical protein
MYVLPVAGAHNWAVKALAAAEDIDMSNKANTTFSYFCVLNRM